MFLVLIETSGNQNFIFSTNKLKENVGASELTYRAGTKWILEAVGKATDQQGFQIWKDANRVRRLLRDDKINPPIEETSDNAVEIVTAASGKALLLTHNKETAQRIIQSVTHKALVEAPGLDIAGVYEEIKAWDDDNTLAESIRKVHGKFEQVRSRLPSPVSRFLRLPIVADCAASGLPASEVVPPTSAQRNDGKQAQPISKVSAVKRQISEKAKDRLTNLDERLASQIDRLLQAEEDTDTEQNSWLAIVHADGNGLGQIFLNFDKFIGDDKSNRNYIERYQAFSLSLDECTEKAFTLALNVFPTTNARNNKAIAPIVPLIIGGDDLTVVCDGRYALEFTRVFLQEFERQTELHPDISLVAEQAFGVGRLSACAGVAIVKHHFPFSVAYSLAEQLIKSAKVVKQKITCKATPQIPSSPPFPCSALDFHILYDTSGVDLSDIRDKLMPRAEIKLYNHPYVVTLPEPHYIKAKSSLTDEDIGLAWAEPRHWDVLTKWVDLVNQSQLFPNSQAHALRTSLFLGKAEAEAQYQLIQNRYPELKKFLEQYHKASLFREEKSKIRNGRVKTYQITSFLDALDAKDFFQGEHDNNSETAEHETGVAP